MQFEVRQKNVDKLVSVIVPLHFRAYLMSVDFEKPVDNERDMLDKGWKLYLPLGTPFMAMYQTSPIEAQAKLGVQVEENNQLFAYDQGLTPLDLEKRIVREGRNKECVSS